MKILLTAFNAFGNLPVNPSQVIVEEFASRRQTSPHCQIHSAVLETSYSLSRKRITKLLDELRPDVLLMFGVAQNRPCLSVERQACNWDNATVPDNTGEIRVGRPIAPGGPAVYRVTIPPEELTNALRHESIPAELSNDAGAFVCNHTLYTALDHAERFGHATRCGFIHIPLPVELSTSTDRISSLTIANLLRGIDVCIDVARNLGRSTA